MGDVEQAAPDGVEAVGDVREKQRRVVFEKPREGVRQHLVGAVADENLFRSHLVIAGQSRSQRGSLWIRVETQRVGRFRANCLQCARRRSDRALVGVEFHQIGHVGLFTRHIGVQVMRQAAPETAHLPRPCFIRFSGPSLPRWRVGRLAVYVDLARDAYPTWRQIAR